ncbi:MAG: plasmid mobilization protein [Ginsengibacter sp.]
MNEQKNLRNKWLHLRVSEAEYKKIKNGFSKSTKRKISEYIRSILLGKPNYTKASFLTTLFLK